MYKRLRLVIKYLIRCFVDLLTSRAWSARSAIVRARASERGARGPFNEKQASDFEKV